MKGFFSEFVAVNDSITSESNAIIYSFYSLTMSLVSPNIFTHDAKLYSQAFICFIRKHHTNSKKKVD